MLERLCKGPGAPSQASSGRTSSYTLTFPLHPCLCQPQKCHSGGLRSRSHAASNSHSCSRLCWLTQAAPTAPSPSTRYQSSTSARPRPRIAHRAGRPSLTMAPELSAQDLIAQSAWLLSRFRLGADTASSQNLSSLLFAPGVRLCRTAVPVALSKCRLIPCCVSWALPSRLPSRSAGLLSSCSSRSSTAS